MQFLRETRKKAVRQVAGRICQELETGKRVLWLVSGGSNVAAEVEEMKLVRERAEDRLSGLAILPMNEHWGAPGHAGSITQHLRDAGFDPNDHNDGMQVRGVHNLTVRKSVIDMGPFMASLNAAIFLENANDGNSDVTITDNYLNGGGFITRFGPVSGTFTFTGNIYGPDAGFSEFQQFSPLPTTQNGNLDHNLNPLTLVVNN